MSSKADQLIESALSNRASSLSLAGLGLESLPESLIALTSLKELNIARNQLAELPNWLETISALERINLAGNKLTRLPAWLTSNRNLTDLNLTGNRLTQLPDSLGHLTLLRSLNVARNQIVRLPVNIGALVALIDLDLSSNQLSALPDSICNLLALTDLDLSRNELDQLPEGIGSLTALKRLHVGNNRLVALPDRIGDLTALTRLDLTGNQLSGLPGRIGDLTALTRLDLARNELSVLPSRLGDLTMLTNLNLDDNQLDVLPAQIGHLLSLDSLSCARNHLATLPEEIGDLIALTDLDVSGNQLLSLPARIGSLSQLTYLNLADNRLASLPDEVTLLNNMTSMHLANNELASLPEMIGNLVHLRQFDVGCNQLTSVPLSLGNLGEAEVILSGNPMAPELQAAYDESANEFKSFLNLLQADGQFIHEAKLILVGEGEVGKSCLLAAMRGEAWDEHRPTTHGIEIKPLTVTHQDTSITLNGWDFGGQRVYRPTHQLFFSAPAIYLVVWNPRVGPERNFVDYWIDLIKHRAGSGARILVVATHGGPGERNAYLDEAAIRSRYGEMIVGFYHVDSKNGTGIEQIVDAVAAAAHSLSYVARWYPATWRRLREAIDLRGSAYLTYKDYEAVAADHHLSPTSAKSLIRISNALGHWICHAEDPASSDLVIFKPDWLSTAISFVLDDIDTIKANGLLPHNRLPQLWNNPNRPSENRYPPEVYPVFLQLMERFDISYRLTDQASDDEPHISLVAQLVPAGSPQLSAWDAYHPELETRTQICEIVDAVTGEPVEPEGLMYQLIVRFHRFSLGRRDYRSSIHWQSGLVLDDNYNGRAVITVDRNRVFVQVRAAYPQFFLRRLTEDIQDQVHTFWKGLHARIMVPCYGECSGYGLFDIAKLTLSRQAGRAEYPCPECPRWLNIDSLLLGTSVADKTNQNQLLEVVRDATAPAIAQVIEVIEAQGKLVLESVTQQSKSIQGALSQAEERYRNLILALDDEARDGPRLFTVSRLKPSVFRPGITNQRIEVSLWCEHSRLPLYLLDGPKSSRGVYHIDVPRVWLVKAAPWIRAVSIIVRSLLPVSLAGVEMGPSDAQLKSLAQQLKLAEASVEALANFGGEVSLDSDDALRALRAAGDTDDLHVDGSLLRALHSFLRETDPTFGGLERVRDRNRYKWVYPSFVQLYQPPPPSVPLEQ